MSILTLLITFLGSLFKSHRQLALENLALRQQVTMPRQSVKRPRTTAADKLFCSKRYVNKRKESTKQPDALDDPSPSLLPQRLADQHWRRVARFVGCKWSFYPRGRPLFGPYTTNILPVEFMEIS
jgi:hypothetical protein